MRKLIFICCLITIICIFFSDELFANNNFYKKDAFEFLVPDDWVILSEKIKNASSIEIVLVPKEFIKSEEVYISLHYSKKEDSKKHNIENIWDTIKKGFRTSDNTVTESSPITFEETIKINDITWKKGTTYWESKKIPLKCKQMIAFTLKENNEYFIQYNSLLKFYDKYLPDFESFINSLKIKGAKMEPSSNK